MALHVLEYEDAGSRNAKHSRTPLKISDTVSNTFKINYFMSEMRKLYIIPISLLLIFFFACKKEDPRVNIILSVEVIHHTLPIANAWVFMKSGATEFLGKDTTVYNWEKQLIQRGLQNLPVWSVGINTCIRRVLMA